MSFKLTNVFFALSSLLLVLESSFVYCGECPFADIWSSISTDIRLNSSQFNYDGKFIDYDVVVEDIKKVLNNSQEFWPADFGNYGPLMIRLAWHCSGSYRDSDGRGGCDGARIRFNPERSWADNTNLDKALNILQPIKLKYGNALSWGDLIVLTGNTAIRSMGGPVLGFCGGRQDDRNGYDSLELGPTPEQEAVFNCAINGECKEPLGPSTIGLIYVDPQGPMANGDPVESAAYIREVFGRMGFNDNQTVALIGGGHAFGKSHGACPTGPGPDPTQDPQNPYPGTCGSGPNKGKGKNAYTSGIEGQWTTKPIIWSNEYYKNLLNFNWVIGKGPGGALQWHQTNDTSLDLMMMTTDIALLHDKNYLEIVRHYAKDLKSLEYDFSSAWYTLTTRDMGPATRCKGKEVPPPQPFQNPLPPNSVAQDLIDFDLVTERLVKSLHTKSPAIDPDVASDGKVDYGPLFITLAWQCASTWRMTDYSGGCNGAQLRFTPQNTWPNNKGMLDVIKVLESVKDSLPKPSGLISIADLIVLAGQVALKNAGNVSIPFSGGRTDALDGGISGKLAPRTYYNSSIVASRDNMKIMGLSPHLWVALAGRPRSIVQQIRLGYSGSYTTDSTKFNNQYFQVLLANQWQLRSNTSLIPEYKSIDKDLFVLETDMALIWDNEFKAIVQEYATNEQWFKDNFAKAWNLLMNADMFILDKQTNNGASSVFSCSFSIVFSIILSIYVNLK